MGIRYGLTIDNQNLIIERAKSRKNGVYMFRGVAYRVVDGCVTHFAWDRNILQPYGNFNVVIGSCESYESGRIKSLKDIK